MPAFNHQPKSITEEQYSFPVPLGVGAELAWVAAYITKMVTHPSTNRARRKTTLLMCPTSLPLRQTATVIPLLRYR